MRALPITGEYPADWNEVGDRVRAENGHRCIRCGHRYKTGEHGKGEWSPCDEKCNHGGPLALMCRDSYERAAYTPLPTAEGWTAERALKNWANSPAIICAQWRILTVHHLDGDKANCSWWNLLSLCQRCHLTIQSRVNPAIPYFLEHSAWFRPYVAGYYAKRYEGREITREEAMARLDELLAYERIA